MRNLLFVLLSVCILLGCGPDETPTPQPSNNNNNSNTSDTISLGMFTGTLITDHISGGVHNIDTIEDCQLLATIFGTGTDPDTIMKVRITIPAQQNISLLSQGDVAATYTNNGTLSRMAVGDSCYNLFLQVSFDGNSAEFDQTSICDPTTEYHFTGTK